MIIKKITIENFLCYFGIKEFELSDGLNIILGENGEGKTKFFEALEWLFSSDNPSLRLLVSAKALAEAEVNEEFRVRVGITVEQYDVMKTVTKSFNVKKLEDDAYSTINCLTEGIEETNTGERNQVDGNYLLEKIFPSRIRRYSMFKGEAQLDIFKNEDALMNLINSFSSAKHYEKYAEKGEYLREKAEKAVDEATRSDKNNQKEYRRLESEIAELSKKKKEITVFINSTEEQLKKTEELIHEAEKYVNNAEALQTINERINSIDKQTKALASSIDENYTTALFDEEWILVNFEKIHHEFSKKVTEIACKKRELQSDFDKQIGIKEGKKLMESQLLNNSIPLPNGVPSKAHMEEMLKDEFCKVCNRKAKKGSEAYKFMHNRLKDYLKSQIPEKLENDENKILFKKDYMSMLFNMSVSQEDNLAKLRSVKSVIKELFEFNKRKKEELDGLKQKNEIEIEEREKIIGNSKVGAEKLGNVLKNYNGWQTDYRNFNKGLNDYKIQLKNIEEELNQRKVEKERIDTKSANTFLIKTREVLRDIEDIFTSVKENKLDEFIEIMQKKSNKIFESINVESFIGKILFNKKIIAGKNIVGIELQESDGRIFHKPSQSLLTSMHISILLAISELATELDIESYPMIFDAPTSSFGETKTTQFLNLIFSNTNQKILLIKDFLSFSATTKRLTIKKEFNNVKRHKAFWILLERPFDKNELSTLNTQIITL